MGTLFAAKLAPHAEVWVVSSHPDTVEALNSDGARISLDGREVQSRVKATSNPRLASPADLALICVKAYETERAAIATSRLLASDGMVLTLQNGLGNREVLERVIPSEQVLVGVTYLGASWLGPGKVRQAGEGPTYLVAKSSSSSWAEDIVRLFRQAGLESEVRQDGDSVIWGKLLVNAAINPLTALLRVPNGALISSPALRQLLADAVSEAVEVAKADSIALPYADPTAQVEEVCRRSRDNRSSMLQDVMRKRPTEIEAINGAIIREGERLGVDTPLHRTLRGLVKAVEGSYQLQVKTE
ncbi:MAG: 2-dehydropantoate 2-reductase [Chloroflexi bacterium]|nr:2-dehydropantoate 2-reductase [Chloroflexota bacterium]